MTTMPLYKQMMADGTLDRRHELALMRYAACREAARKTGWRHSSDDETFLTAQYAFFEGNICSHAKVLLDLLTEPADPNWTLQDYMDEMHTQWCGIELTLVQVGVFLAIDHPARCRAEKKRESRIAAMAEIPASSGGRATSSDDPPLARHAGAPYLKLDTSR
jgi:hypothetical protein